MIVWQRYRFNARRIVQVVSLFDVLPSLVDIAAENTGAPKPEPIDPLDGRSLVALCDGDDADDPNFTISEYLAEGTGAPMLMIRKCGYKYTHCPTDPEQLFDLHADPDELNNLADSADATSILASFRADLDAHWDADELQARVIADQHRRRAVHAALRNGRYQSWDFQPRRDAADEYTRSHLELTDFDVTSRYPRPSTFEPFRK